MTGKVGWFPMNHLPIQVWQMIRVIRTYHPRRLAGIRQLSGTGHIDAGINRYGELMWRS